MYIAGVNRPVDTGDSYFSEIYKTNTSGSGIAKVKLQRERISKLVISDTKPLEARIEHSRWIVDCPNCNSAEFAFEDNVFFCSYCNNSDIKGKSRKVKFPKERKEIEEVLSVRQIKNRHWYPNETLDKLKTENTSKLGVI